jgi:serine protease
MQIRHTIILIAISLVLTACGGDSASFDRDTGATIQAVPAYVSFPGTSTATVSISASGSWTAATEQSWIDLSSTSGSGDAILSVTVDRSGLVEGHYAGTVLIRGDGVERETVTVYMRFPELSGNITSPSGQLQVSGMSMAEPLSGGENAYAPDEVLVMLEPAMTRITQGGQLQSTPAGAPSVSFSALRDTARQLASDYGLKAGSALSESLPIFRFETKGHKVPEVVRMLKRDGRVKAVQPNYIVTAFGTPDDSLYSDQWHYPRINLPQAWDLTQGSDNIVVAVVDSGTDTSHPDLAGQILSGYDFSTSSALMSDGSGHGTHVSGTVAAASNNSQGVAGVSWTSRLLPVRVLDDSGSGTSDEIYAGILYAAGFCVNNSNGIQVCPEHKADVINLSLGLQNPLCEPMPGGTFYEEAVAWAANNGVVVVAAAGNDGCGVVTIPAALPSVIAVAATGPTDVFAPYSNWGEEIWIAAPGGDQANFGTAGGVLSTYPAGGFEYLEGTSMASPHVAGVSALMLAANPNLSAAEIRLILRDTANDLGPTGWDPDYGYGLVNAESAVQLARDLLTAQFADFTIRLRQGGSIVEETRADGSGNFTIESVPEGSYTLEAGNDQDNDGILGEPGEFYGSTTVSIAYSGDLTGAGLNVQPQ